MYGFCTWIIKTSHNISITSIWFGAQESESSWNELDAKKGTELPNIHPICTIRKI